MPTSSRPQQPWDGFLKELDSAVDTIVRLDCIGGFAVTQIYGLDRPTGDVDVVELAPDIATKTIIHLGIQGGALHTKYGVYLDHVGVAKLPENYGERLIEIFAGAYKNLRLMAVDPYDLALSKLERNNQKDRDDVRHLARSVPFDLSLLKERYAKELRWQLGVPGREDLTLQLWTEMIQEDKVSHRGK